jgi:hypothetical protein
MRQIEVRTIDEDIKGVFVEGEFTGFSFTKAQTNLMLDDLIATQASARITPKRSRNELMTELVSKTLGRCYAGRPLEGGQLKADELAAAVSLVTKSCKKGWFS